MKKKATLILACLMVLGLVLSACSGRSGDGGTSTPGSSQGQSQQSGEHPRSRSR